MNNEPAMGLLGKHNEAASLVAQMSLQEKASLASGRNFWHLAGVERLALKPVMVTDGPHGLRKQNTSSDHVGLNQAVPATCFPTASALASSWDLALLERIGVALGEQCVAEDVAVLLGPGMNIKRHALCGRNFEYFSEDPLLSGELAAAMIMGVQSQGVGTSIKHFAVNNQEHGRMYVDAVIDERTLREIYLKGFEIAVRKAQPWTVMCAYNRVNGVYCAEHQWLLNEVLRDEWGFRGLVVTDWGAANDRVRSVTSGLDLEMPGSGGVNDRRIERAVTSGELREADLDRMITRNVALSLCGAEVQTQSVDLDQDAHHRLAHQAALESAVLLKNEDAFLPLAGGQKMALIGAFAKHPRYQGTGSSKVQPTRLDCAFDALVERCGESQVRYAPGYDAKHAGEDAALLEEAVSVAAQADIAVVFIGLPESYESEGFDRAHMRLPQQHDELVRAVCAANMNTVVVLSNGAPVEMPWVSLPCAILECYLSGQAGGAAVVELLFGDANPSGKLAETFPLQQADGPADAWFPGSGRQVQYREGLYVGYRYFDSADKPVLFPFGHGHSYTTFEYSGLTVTETNTGFDVALMVRNSGAVDGAEVVQLYLHAQASAAYRPQQELKAFAKVRLAAGAATQVKLTLDSGDFAVYDCDAGDWVVLAGGYEVRVGSSSRDIRAVQQVTACSTVQPSPCLLADGPQPLSEAVVCDDLVFAGLLGRSVPAPEPARPFHLNSSMQELAAHSWLGLRVRNRAVAEFKQTMGVGDATLDPTTARMFEEMVEHMPLRSFALFSRGRLSFKTLQVLVALLNHRYLEAIRLLLTEAPKWD